MIYRLFEKWDFHSLIGHFDELCWFSTVRISTNIKSPKKREDINEICSINFRLEYKCWILFCLWLGVLQILDLTQHNTQGGYIVPKREKRMQCIKSAGKTYHKFYSTHATRDSTHTFIQSTDFSPFFMYMYSLSFNNIGCQIVQDFRKV